MSVDRIQQEETRKKFNEKLEKKEKYISYLRENFQPKIDPEKQEEIHSRVKKLAKRSQS